MALSSERHDSTVNPDRGIYVEMESVMEVRYTSDDPDFRCTPTTTTPCGIGLLGQKFNREAMDLHSSRNIKYLPSSINIEALLSAPH